MKFLEELSMLQKGFCSQAAIGESSSPSPSTPYARHEGASHYVVDVTTPFFCSSLAHLQTQLQAWPLDDLFQQLPAVKAYVDDCKLSYSYCYQDSQCAATVKNKQLQLVEEWEKVWQVNFTPKMTQAMMILQSPAAS